MRLFFMRRRAYSADCLTDAHGLLTFMRCWSAHYTSLHALDGSPPLPTPPAGDLLDGAHYDAACGVAGQVVGRAPLLWGGVRAHCCCSGGGEAPRVVVSPLGTLTRPLSCLAVRGGSPALVLPRWPASAAAPPDE